jgi:CheY-like chemotaxis protein
LSRLRLGRHYSLLIADSTLPDRDGLALLRALQHLQQQLPRPLPLVILMANSHGTHALRAATANPVPAGILTKPFTASALREATGSAFGQKSLAPSPDGTTEHRAATRGCVR